MKWLNVFILMLLFSFARCKEKKEASYATENTEQYDETSVGSNDYKGYSDEEYCATIDYYNPKTGTSSIYTLTEEVENGKLVKIN